MKWYIWEVCSREMERRIAAGNKVNGALAALVRLRNVSTAARLAVHNTVLVPTLLYGSETWILQKKKEIKMPWRRDLFVGLFAYCYEN